MRRVYQFRHWGNGGNATASITAGAMRATPKLIYPSYLRVFMAAIAWLFWPGSEGMVRVRGSRIDTPAVAGLT